MDQLANALKIIEKVMYSANIRAAKTQLRYAFGAGLAGLVLIGLVFCLQLGLSALKDAEANQNATSQNPAPKPSGNNESTKINSTINETVKHYYELQLEELKRYRFTKMQNIIAVLVLNGETNRAIAASLNIAESTVKKYVRQILTKTDTSNRKDFCSLIRIRIERKRIPGQ